MSKSPKQKRGLSLDLVSLGSINPDGSQRRIHPQHTPGNFNKWRSLVAFFLLTVGVILPWIPINGHPAVFLDIASRRFHLFGFTLATQDLWVLFFAVSGLAFTLFFVTSLFGRIWCGWTCPYTLFLEHLFRRVERLVEGDRQARIKLDAAPWSGSKITKRVIKNALYAVLAIGIAHVFISYFVSVPTLYKYLGSNLSQQKPVFIFIYSLAAVLFYCFGYFREQFCVIVCPYGRIQSALTDDDTMIIGYDEKRGEPRGKKNDPNTGDCIDCFRCVTACPTGIDIRNGLQLECIGCAACIDACDDVMHRLKLPPGLIRYDSMKGLEGEKKSFMRPRIYVYLALAALGALVFGLSLYLNASPITAHATRMVGPPYYADDAHVRNNYEIRLINKRNKELSFSIELAEDVEAPENWTLSPAPGTKLTLKPQQEFKQPLIITTKRADFKGPESLKIKITAQPGDTTIHQTVRFLGPRR